MQAVPDKWGKGWQVGEKRKTERETQWAAAVGQVTLCSPREVSAAYVSTISWSSHLCFSSFTDLSASDRSLPSRAGGWSPPDRWAPWTRGARSVSVPRDAARPGCSGGPLEVCHDCWRCSLRGSIEEALRCTLSGCWGQTPLSAGRESLGESWGSCIHRLTCEEECLGVFPDPGTWRGRRSVGGRCQSRWLPRGVGQFLAGV